MSDRSPSAPPMASWTATFFTRLYRYKRLLKNRWYILAFCAAAGAAVQAYRLTGLETTYTSTAKMIVSQRVAVPDNTLVQQVSNTFFGDQLDLMRSTEVRQRAQARVAATDPNLPRCHVELDAQQQPYTSIFLLSATGTQPEYTRAYLDAVMDEYISLRRESRSETSQDAVSLMTEQMMRLEKDVKQGEEELQKFLTTNNILFLEDQSQAAVKRLQQLRSQLSEMESEHRLLGMMTFEQNIEHLKDQSTPSPSVEATAAQASAEAAAAGMADPTQAYQQTMTEIRRLEVEIKDLSRHLRPAHPKMIRLNEEIERQKRLIESFKEESKESLKARRETLALRIENLKQTITAEEKNALELSQRMGEYNRLKSRLTRYQQMYDKLFENTQRVDISSNVDQEQVSRYEPATPARPNTPKVFTGVLNGAGLGLLLGIGILLLLDRIDDRINSLTELRDHFDEPVLGQIPLDPESPGGSIRLITPDDKRHQFVEAYRNVRSSLPAP